MTVIPFIIKFISTIHRLVIIEKEEIKKKKNTVCADGNGSTLDFRLPKDI